MRDVLVYCAMMTGSSAKASESRRDKTSDIAVSKLTVGILKPEKFRESARLKQRKECRE